MKKKLIDGRTLTVKRINGTLYSVADAEGECNDGKDETVKKEDVSSPMGEANVYASQRRKIPGGSNGQS